MQYSLCNMRCSDTEFGIYIRGISYTSGIISKKRHNEFPGDQVEQHDCHCMQVKMDILSLYQNHRILTLFLFSALITLLGWLRSFQIQAR